MHELNSHQFERVSPLFEGMFNPVCIQMIIEGNRDGRIFVDCVDGPTVALLAGDGNATSYFLAGDVKQDCFLQHLPNVLFKDPEQHFLLAAWPEEWEPVLEDLIGDRVGKQFQRVFQFNPDKFDNWNWRDQVPDGYDMKRMDRELTIRLRDEWGFQGWRSVDLFLEKGFGFCLMKENDFVTECYAGCAAHPLYEASFRTIDRSQRNRGFGYLTASAFVEYCLKNGWTPNWLCITDNVSSDIVAKKLGFEAVCDVPQYGYRGSKTVAMRA